MSTTRPVPGNTLSITPPRDAFYRPQTASDLFHQLHGTGETFAVETAISATGIRFYLRAASQRSKAEPLLRRLSPYDAVSLLDDWTLLRDGEDAYIRAMTLSAHTVLPTVTASGKHTLQTWVALRKQVAETTGGTSARLIVRCLLRPAPDEWAEQFQKSMQRRNVSRSPMMTVLIGPDKQNNRRPGIDPDQVAQKLAGPAFNGEIQVALICRKDKKHVWARSVVNDAVDHLMDGLLGGYGVWEKESPIRIEGDRIFRDSQLLRQPRWDLMTFLSERRAVRFPLSPFEIAPLWPAPLATPTKVDVDAVVSPPPTPIKAPAAPAVKKGSTGMATTPSVSRAQKIAPKASVETGPTSTGMQEPAARSESPRSGQENPTVHSAQPPGLPVLRGRDLKTHDSAVPRGKRNPAGTKPVRQAAVPPAFRRLGLTTRDMQALIEVAEMPLSTAPERAYAFGRDVRSSYRSSDRLVSKGLVEGTEVYVAGTKAKRHAVIDQQWADVFDDRALPHSRHALDRLWVNPVMMAGVYRIVGMVVRDRPERTLTQFRWLWTFPFDALAQFSGGWAVFMWSGIWQDTRWIEKRLQRYREEFAEWSSGRGTHWPGRFFCVAPNRWQAERVWRAAGELGWQGSFSVYNLEDDELVGGLDITGSRGAIPPFIVEVLSPLRADVTRWVDFLANDPGSRRFRVLGAIEESPGAKSKYVSIRTGINGRDVKAAFEKLSEEELSYGTKRGEFAPSNWPLAMAARRDRVWPGWPGKRFGEWLVKSWSTQRWKRVADTHRLLSKFREAGCQVAAGWLALDRRFEPDGVVWIAEGPYGPGWHYLLCAARPKSEQSVRDFLKPCLSDERCDRYPLLIVCADGVENLFWELGGHLPMLTATVRRTRGRPLTGREGTPWMQYGAPVSILAGNRP